MTNNINNLKVSRYNLVANAWDGGHLVYNMITGALLHIKDEFFDKCKFLLDTSIPIPDNEAILNAFREAGCIVLKSKNELKELERKFKKDICQKHLLVLTLIPTLDCNLRCKYCYQVRKKSSISDKTANNIMLFIERQLKSKKVRKIITDWIGGEPLLETDKIIYLQNKIKELCSKYGTQLSSSLSTNGYLLTNSIIDALFKGGVQKINITLAGDLDSHNLLRAHRRKTDSFQRIYGNLQKIDRRFELMLNIDIGTTNRSSIPELLNHIQANPLTAKFAIVFNRIESFDARPCKELEIPLMEYMPLHFELLEEAVKRQLPIANKSRFGMSGHTFCGAQYKNNFTINWDGKVYKCAEFGKKTENVIGELTNRGTVEICPENLKQWSFDPFSDDQCLNCGILPYCLGGCTQKRNSGKHFCPEEKDFLPETLKSYSMFLAQKAQNQSGTIEAGRTV